MAGKRKIEFVELTVESIGFQGISIARKEGLVYFVKGGIPGDEVKAQIRRKKKNRIETNIVEVLKPSDDRIPPVCDYFGVCGGCSWQHLDYAKQLYWKQVHVKDSFERIGNFENLNYLDILPSPDVYQYRNKMEFSFSSSRWLDTKEIESEQEIKQKNFALGLHIPGRYDKVLDIKECHIQKITGNDVLNAVREQALSKEISAYNQHTHKGFLRNLIIRTTKSSNELMLVLITNDITEQTEEEFLSWFGNDMPNEIKGITSIIYAINNTNSPVAYGEPNLLYGKDFISENILGIDFNISPFSFFQTNPSQLNQFIGNIIKKAEINKENIIWDLFCGSGSITLPASKFCKEIIGLELNQESIDKAKENAVLNGIDNAEFLQADLIAKQVPEILNQLPKPDTIILDPPRAGLHKNLINHLLQIKAKNIVYVSCNPTTQARDCEILSSDYDIISIQAVDMFPHTFHVESIAVLKAKG